MSDLREQLERRLLMAFGEGRFRFEREGVGGVWSPVVDEVIRQMEWARRKVLLAWADDEGYQKDSESLRKGPAKLSLAPEDWKP